MDDVKRTWTWTQNIYSTRTTLALLLYLKMHGVYNIYSMFN
jgi:hypothetical protein